MGLTSRHALAGLVLSLAGALTASAPAQQFEADKETGTFTMATTGQRAVEGGSPVQVEIRGPRWLWPVSIPYALSGTAVVGEDVLVDPPSPVTFPAGTRSVFLTVTLLDDAVFEPDETLAIELQRPLQYGKVGDPSTHVVMLQDDDCVVSDDFNHCGGLIAPWTYLDPIGDGSVAVSGVGTDDAWATLSVPGGSDHLSDGSALAARLVQPMADGDCHVGVSIETDLTADGQVQGFQIEQDALEWLRFEVARVSGAVHVRLAATTGGVTTTVVDTAANASVPFMLKVVRIGDDWTFSWLDDQGVWSRVPVHSQALAVAQIGLFAGNLGGAGAPAHDAAFDWLQDLDQPLPTEDGFIPGTGPFTLTVPIVGNGAVTKDPDLPDYTCSDVVTLTAMPDPGWQFDHWEGDLSGSANPETIAMTDDRTVTAVFVNDSPPTISNVLAVATQDSAWVTWDTDEPATSLVEYGLDSGHGMSVSDPGLKTSHALQITGLTAATLYHFRVCSEDASQNQACTQDATFGTRLISDDFNHCEGIVAPWVWDDPIGDGSTAVSGVGTDDAWVTLSVPGGSDHLPVDTALSARLQQPMADADYALAVKIESELTSDGQVQGLIVDQDDQEWIRFEVYAGGGGPNVRLAATTGGVTTTIADAPIVATAPYWLQVDRSGDDWTFSWSDDGLAWNDLPVHARVLAPTRVGLYAGNTGGAAAPAHDAAFDWFEDVDRGLGTEDGSIPGSGPFTLTVPIQGDGSVSRDPDQPTYTCSDVVTLTAMPDPGWLFDHWEDDLAGSENPETIAMTSDRTATAVFVPDPPPTISNVIVVTTATTALVTWDTDEPATSLVEYGPDSNYGSSVSDGALVTSHSLLITGLTPASLYHFRVCSEDAGMSQACSLDDVFVTRLVSDDFNHCEGLIAPWTYLDPIGDGAMRVVGVGTDDAWLELLVPAGSSHAPFGSVLPARAVQPLVDEDLQFAVKVESPLTTGTQIQGLTVEQDGDDWIRFDIYRDGGGNTNVFVATTTAGTTTTVADAPIVLAPPMHLRVTRVGDDWTMEWSATGTGPGDRGSLPTWNVAATFELPLVATQVGLYAGNSGGAAAPAHVASFDWFQDTGDPLITEDGSFPGSGPFTLTANVTGSGSITVDPDQPTYTCSDVVTVTAVDDPAWDFDHWEDDLGGSNVTEQLAMTADRTITAVFVPDSTPPVISNVLVQPSVFGATVTWTTSEPCTSRVDYGLSSGYGDFVESLALVTEHSLFLPNLAPDTEYHFMVTSVDDAGLSDSTADATFQTLSSSGLVSDDFNHCEGLIAPWTYLEPIGDGAMRVTGVGTDDAFLELMVPAGSSHAPFDTVLTDRVVQPVNDVDFQIEVKLESDFTAGTQIQGLTIEQDDSEWIRFDVYRAGANTFVFVGSTTGGSTTTVTNAQIALVAPMHLRVTRATDDWTMEWSGDGQAWTQAAMFNQALVATQIGLWAGNSGGGGAPAHTARFDWFQDNADPLVTEDGSFPGSGPHTLTVNTTGQGMVTKSPDEPTYTCSDVVTVTAAADPAWDFDEWQGDLGGSMETEQIAMTADRTVTAVFVPDATPPTILNLVVTPSSNGALVTWDTDEPATSRVDYGPDTGYGSFVEDLTLKTSHSLQIVALDPDTTYQYSVSSTDDAALTTSTPNDQFQTKLLWLALSDDFDRCTAIPDFWTFTDPAGDAPQPTVQGVGTGDAQLVMSVPGGSSHQMFDTIGAPYLSQQVNDTDFDLEVKFESDLTAAFQIQGVLVKQDDARWLRFDFYYDGSEVRLFAGSTTANDTTQIGDFSVGAVSEPMWMALGRVADLWTLRWSTDGTSWTTVLMGITEVLNVSECGVYVGNAVGATAPAHTMLVDYFLNHGDPIANEDMSFDGGGPYAITTFVDPPGAGLVTKVPDEPQYDCSELVVLTGVANPGWFFSHWSGDSESTSDTISVYTMGDRTYTAHFVPDTDPPVISDLQVAVGPDSATITWTTDEPATSVVDYGTSVPYSDQVSDPTLVVNHSVQLTGLLRGTLYHFEATSADAGGLESMTGDQTFTTTAVGSLVSDDFNAANLDLGLWEWVDPLGPAAVQPDDLAKLRMVGWGTTDAQLEISVPDGVEYVHWIVNDSARVMQAVADTDFEMEVKIESVLDSKYQSVGLVVEEDDDTWLRFDYQHTGALLRVVRASFDAGVASNLVITDVQNGAWTGQPLWMKVNRTGDDWTHSYSIDGVNYFTNGAAMSVPLNMTKVGLNAANEASNNDDPPGVTAVFDYVFNSASPIGQEDFRMPADQASPFLYVVGGRTASDTAVRVQWGTDEPTDGTVAWGLSQGVYDQGSLNGNAGVWEDSVLVTGLLPDTTYHFQVMAGDAAGNPAGTSSDFTLTTAPAGEDGHPELEIWYGQPGVPGDNTQRFGHLGTSQTWVNVLGNVTDSYGELASLSYTLNGGASSDLSWGIGGFNAPFRLLELGDFNVEMDAALLMDDSVGLNEVVITATDDDGFTTQETVWVDYDADGVWPENVSIDWSTVTDLQDVIQVVDGYWEVDPDSGLGGTPALRNSRNGDPVMGYDRLVTIGDDTWDDYEFEFPLTVHELNPEGFFPASNSHAVGVIVRWPGHNGGVEQPQELFFPLGGLFAYRWFNPGVKEYWHAYSTNFNPNIKHPDFFMQVVLGTTYVLRGQCETQGDGTTIYRMKSWVSGAPEPPGWFCEMTTPVGNVGTGSLLILSHELDASIGNITIVPLN